MEDKMIDFCKTYLPTYNEIMEISKDVTKLKLSNMDKNMYWGLPESLVSMVYFVNFMNYRLYVHGDKAYNKNKFKYTYMKFSLMYDDNEPDFTTTAPTMYVLQHPKRIANPFIKSSNLDHDEISNDHSELHVNVVLVAHLSDGTITIIDVDSDEFKLFCDDIIETYIETTNKRISEY